MATKKQGRIQHSSRPGGKLLRDFLWTDEYSREIGLLSFWAHLRLHRKIYLITTLPHIQKL